MSWRSDASAAGPGVAELASQLRDDAIRAAKAEVAVHKARLADKAGALKQVAMFGGAAAVLALAALITLLVGLVLSLATLIGPLAATVVVVAAALLVAFLLARVAQGHLARMGETS